MTTKALSARAQTETQFSSILFDRAASGAERDDLSVFSDAVFRDLNLDQVFTAVTSGRDEYDLMPFLRAPLRDVHSVEYRHQVQRDLEQQPVARAVADFTVQMREMRDHLALSHKLRARYQRERWFLEAARVYCQAVTALADALGPLELGSPGLTSPAEIVYRQHVLADCIDHPDVVRGLYDLAVETLTEEKRTIGFTLRDSPESIAYRARQQMQLYAGMFRRLRELADTHAARFRSEGFTRFFAMLSAELGDEYLAEVEAQIGELEFRHGTLMSVRLGPGNKGTRYVLRRHPRQGWQDWMSGLSKRSAYSFTVPERDENGLLALSDLTNRGLSDASNALAQSADHIRAFFGLLRAELGFYLSCLNLRDRLVATGAPVCFPVPGRPVLYHADRLSLSARGLCDASLALSLPGRAVGNDVDADGKQLIMITGANQGGKSTFLRSTGQAQLMMQAGMFVAAQSYAATVSTGIFTHFKREEDAAMEMGKLDEELDRMGRITDQLRPGCLLLCNESFASTNEREGSEIARQVIRALTEARVRVIFVTHLYDLAGRWYARHDQAALFLRAEREPGGHRTFRVPPGEPLPTSYGQDLYQQVFGTVPA